MAKRPGRAGRNAAESDTALVSAMRLPPVFAAEITGRDRDGDLIGIPLDWTSDEPRPKLLIHVPRRDKRQPGVGDHVLVKLDRLSNAQDFGGVHARVMKVLGRKPARLLGIFRSHGGGSGRLQPIDKKSGGVEIGIAPNLTMQAEDGELVAVEILSEGRLGLQSAKVVERIGMVGGERAASIIAIHAHGIPHVFSNEVLEAAERLKQVTIKNREDWRKLPLVTIDPADAKDHDDAVHAAADTDEANPNGFVLTIAIADVSTYVEAGGIIDKEAVVRGNSVYFPDRVVPMLPERISNNLCSLIEGSDRPALAVRVIIDRNGRKLSHTFHRIMMRSHAKLAYERAQAIIDDKDPDADASVKALLKTLHDAYCVMAKARDARGPLALDLPERKLILDVKGRVETVVTKDRLDTHRLIEEMMILANVCAAETLIEKRTGLLFRIHDEPSLAKMESLRAFLKSLDFDLPKAGAVRPDSFNRILERFKITEQSALVNDMVLRSQAQAEYAPDNIGHFGLNLRNYAHFTSPIRRYADLVVHRSLIRALGLGEDGGTAPTGAELRQLGEQISVTERRAMLAERDTFDRLLAEHLSTKIGATFQGRISGVTRSGLFVKLTDTGADGFVPAATLGADFYRHDEVRQALVGDRTGEGYQLGDIVEVRLSEAEPVTGGMRFGMLSKGRAMRPVGDGKRWGRRGRRDTAGPSTRPGYPKGGSGRRGRRH
jgi:ribonuclease R